MKKAVLVWALCAMVMGTIVACEDEENKGESEVHWLDEDGYTANPSIKEYSYHEDGWNDPKYLTKRSVPVEIVRIKYGEEADQIDVVEIGSGQVLSVMVDSYHNFYPGGQVILMEELRYIGFDRYEINDAWIRWPQSYEYNQFDEEE